VKRRECKGVPIVHHDKYVSELPLKHRFAMRKFHGVLRFLRTDGVISMKQVVEPEQVPASIAGLIHTPDYVEKFFTGNISPDEQRMTGFPWSEGLVRRCRYETGGTILAARLALERGLACSTGGGTHHAYADKGSGYCLLNDMAVTAASLLDDGTVQRVLIVDLDVHQGDGTAHMFRSNTQVFTFSIHCQQNFPFNKQASDLDIGLHAGCQDKEYLAQLEEHLPWVVDSFRPDLVLYDAGVDPHVKDELGKLDLTDQGLFDRDLYVLRHMASRGIPCATVIGGGYSRDLNALSCRHTIVHRAASKGKHDAPTRTCTLAHVQKRTLDSRRHVYNMPTIKLEDIALTGVVTIGSGFQLINFAGKVFTAREKYKVTFPAVTGNENFERVFRAQQNTLEWYPIYMTSLWTSSLFFHQVPSAIVGAVYIYSRHKYFEGYSRSVEERIPGFFLGAKCLLALSAMASAGCITVLLRTYGNIDLAALFKDCLKDTVGLRFTC
ncbi:hypothetical protein BaRGS_00032023, partial [Batillaria attramentaria]